MHVIGKATYEFRLNSSLQYKSSITLHFKLVDWVMWFRITAKDELL